VIAAPTARPPGSASHSPSQPWPGYAARVFWATRREVDRRRGRNRSGGSARGVGDARQASGCSGRCRRAVEVALSSFRGRIRSRNRSRVEKVVGGGARGRSRQMKQAVVKWSHGRPGHDLDTLWWTPDQVGGVSVPTPGRAAVQVESLSGREGGDSQMTLSIALLRRGFYSHTPSPNSPSRSSLVFCLAPSSLSPQSPPPDPTAPRGASPRLLVPFSSLSSFSMALCPLRLTARRFLDDLVRDQVPGLIPEGTGLAGRGQRARTGTESDG
jgi:hypothetical protein